MGSSEAKDKKITAKQYAFFKNHNTVPIFKFSRVSYSCNLLHINNYALLPAGIIPSGSCDLTGTSALSQFFPASIWALTKRP